MHGGGDVDLAVLRPTRVALRREIQFTAVERRLHPFLHIAVRRDTSAVLVTDNDLRPLIDAVRQRRARVVDFAVRIDIADGIRAYLRVAFMQLLQHEIAAHRAADAAHADEEARMAEGQRRRQEAVHRRVRPFFADDFPTAAEEHLMVAHAKIALLVMDLAQIEIHKPRIRRQIVRTILRVVAVRQTAVEAVVRPFGIDGAVPCLLLMEHDFAV